MSHSHAFILQVETFSFLKFNRGRNGEEEKNDTRTKKTNFIFDFSKEINLWKNYLMYATEREKKPKLFYTFSFIIIIFYLSTYLCFFSSSPLYLRAKF